MLLRKHLTGGRITDILQYDFDRIIILHIQAWSGQNNATYRIILQGKYCTTGFRKADNPPLKDHKLQGQESFGAVSNMNFQRLS